METPPSAIDSHRRPIAARKLPVFALAATRLARAGVSANTISLGGMVFGMAGGAALASTRWWPDLARPAWIAGAVCIMLRLLANMLDGMVAVESGTASPVGELYNEVPDRISDTFILLGLGYGAAGSIVLGYAAALAAMLTAYVRALGKAAGGPSEFCGPFAKQQRMFLTILTALFLALAPAAWRPEWQGWTLPAAMLALIAAGSAGTALRRLLRIAVALRRPRPA